MRLTGVFLEDTSEMPKYTVNWPSGCITCASRHIGQREKPPLTPIPVAGPFDKVGVDILQLPKSFEGKQYATVSVDYLTKWPEVFAVKD